MNMKDETIKDMLQFSLQYCGRKEGLKLVQRHYGHAFLVSARHGGSDKDALERVNGLLCEALKVIYDNDL